MFHGGRECFTREFSENSFWYTMWKTCVCSYTKTCTFEMRTFAQFIPPECSPVRNAFVFPFPTLFPGMFPRARVPRGEIRVFRARNGGNAERTERGEYVPPMSQRSCVRRAVRTFVGMHARIPRMNVRTMFPHTFPPMHARSLRRRAVRACMNVFTCSPCACVPPMHSVSISCVRSPCVGGMLFPYTFPVRGEFMHVRTFPPARSRISFFVTCACAFPCSVPNSFRVQQTHGGM